jgi:putative SOS response-associated peptidase YedK
VPADAPLFAFAGLWENWRDPAQGADAAWLRSCTIVTGEPNELLAPIHQRMPVILPEDAWAQWLGEAPATSGELRALLKPYPAERMRLYPVSTRVNSVKNDDIGLLEPLMAEGGVRV